MIKLELPAGINQFSRTKTYMLCYNLKENYMRISAELRIAPIMFRFDLSIIEEEIYLDSIGDYYEIKRINNL